MGHIYGKEFDMAKATMCTHIQSDHALSHSKCVLWCCAECPYINLPDQEIDKKYEDTTPSISFNIYCIIGRCTAHSRITLKDKNILHV